jgi:hypothetical protein
MNRRTVMDRLWIIAERAKKAAVFAEHASPIKCRTICKQSRTT